MESSYAIVVLCFITALIVWVIARTYCTARNARYVERLDLLDRRLAEIVLERDTARKEAAEHRVRVSHLENKVASDAERIRWVETAEKRLTDTFAALSARTLKDNSDSLQALSRRQLEQFANVLRSDWGSQREEIKGVVEPLKTELTNLEAHVRHLEQQREGAYQSLSEQVRQVGAQAGELQRVTTSLDNALRDSGVRGKWGEVQLKRLVEMAGLTEHVDFDLQTVVAGDGGYARPDMVIRLPSGGILPVDAKSPMNAYLESQSAATPELAVAARKRHAAAVRKHVQTLAGKAYWRQFDHAVEIVVMLVPYESGLVAAFDADPALLEDALSNQVVIASPVSFLALLRVIAYGWLQMDMTNNARHIATIGKQFLERLRPFSDHLNKLGEALNLAADRFNDVAGSFERRVLPSARRLKELGASSEDPSDVSAVESNARRLTSPD